MDFRLQQSSELKQTTHLGLEAYQGIELLTLNVVDLQQFLLSTASENIFLTVEERPEIFEPSLANLDCWKDSENQLQDSRSGDYLALDSIPYDSRSLSSAHLTCCAYDDNDYRSALFASLPYCESLSDYLDHILIRTAENESDQAYDILAFIVGNIDDSGYLRTSCDFIAETLGANSTEVERLLVKLQKEAIPGIGARDLSECLLLQLDSRKDVTPLVKSAIANHLEDLSRGRIRVVAEKLHTDVQHVKTALETIKKLDPRPGLQFGSNAPHPVVPEVSVAMAHDGLHVSVLDNYLPNVTLNREYIALFERNEFSQSSKAALRKELKQAQGLLNGIERRHDTIFRIASCIVELQKDYFKHGDESLRPLTMTTVAEILECAVSTVSRVASSIYMQTPQGCIPMRHLFGASGCAKYETSGFDYDLFDDGPGSEMLSSTQIKLLLKQLIDNEDKRNPLDDGTICVLMEAQNIHVSRRTINKYRNAMNIPSKNIRAQQQASA